MKTKTLVILAVIILSISSIVRTFGRILIDIDNPYMDIFVRYSCTYDKQEVHLGVLDGNFHQNNHWGKPSTIPPWHSPESLFFQIVIKNEQNEDVNLQRHDFDIFHGPLSFEEVFKEEFELNEIKGEITYKVIVKVIEHPTLVKINSLWTPIDSLEDPKSINIDELLKAQDWDKVSAGWMEIDTLEIKILYAELDGKEMRLNGDTWRKIQENCTIQESLKQNCVIRCPNCEDYETVIIKKECPEEKSKKKKKKKKLKKDL